MFEPEFTNNSKIKISLNREHPIYDSICSSGKSDLQNPTLFVFYCMGREELNARDTHNDGTYQTIENLRWDLGRNMATLMS